MAGNASLVPKRSNRRFANSASERRGKFQGV
jgi:hypothetical protein